MFKLLLLFLITSITYADVVKPHLIELSVFDSTIELRLNVSIEAIITGIGTNYKNTKEAPTAKQYDFLRKLSAQELLVEFNKFENKFLADILFNINDNRVDLIRKKIKINNVGYTKRPRSSVIIYSAKFKTLKTISWQYNQPFNNAFRFRFYQQDKYSWQSWYWLKPNEKYNINIAEFKPVTIVQNFIKFISIGFQHVIPLGFDHILFIIAMALSTINIFNLITLVSSFTLAHTITLALASSDIIQIPTTFVEPLIAISIAFTAIEVLFFKYKHLRQLIIVFCFGLLHGLGFATMLKTFTSDDFISTLIGFNVGVELAQIIIVSIIFSIVFLLKKYNFKYQILFVIPIASIITLIALYMTFTRIL